MPIEKKVWRYQCDPFISDEATVEVFFEEKATIDGREFKEQKMSPVRVPMVDLFGPRELLDPARVEALAAAPASDRIVPLNHNQPEYLKAEEAVGKLEDAVRASNELSPEEKEARGAEISGVRRLLQGAYAYARSLIGWGVGALLALGAAVQSNVIKSLASDAANWIMQLVHSLLG
jgi:hypothetical protein